MMATHSPHQPIHSQGLADDCQRCFQIAERPFEALDEPNLLALVERTRRWMADEETDALARSKNEQKAMSHVEHALTCMRILERVEAKAAAA